jgi:putative Mg2+ transporter-C (MgtC) family protein
MSVEWIDSQTLTIGARLLMALILGAAVGLERELSQHPAGLRTHILVCLGAAVYTVISSQGLIEASLVEGLTTDGMRIVRDPSRIAAQVVTGIGFIGGGVVLRHGATIRGLTTAASLWMVASIGMLAGSGQLVLAVFSAFLAWLVLSVLGKLGHRFLHKKQSRYNRLRLAIQCDKEIYNRLQTWVSDQFPHR